MHSRAPGRRSGTHTGVRDDIAVLTLCAADGRDHSGESRSGEVRPEQRAGVQTPQRSGPDIADLHCAEKRCRLHRVLVTNCVMYLHPLRGGALQSTSNKTKKRTSRCVPCSAGSQQNIQSVLQGRWWRGRTSSAFCHVFTQSLRSGRKNRKPCHAKPPGRKKRAKEEHRLALIRRAAEMVCGWGRHEEASTPKRTKVP